MTESIITFIFDDGFKEVGTLGREVCKKYNAPACTAVISSKIDQSGHLSAEDIQNLINDKWEILSHTHTHPLKLNNLSPKEIEYEMKTSKEILEKKFNIRVNGFVYPCHSFNDTTVNISTKYYTAVRGSNLQEINIPPIHYYNLNSVMIDDHTLIDKYYSLINTVKHGGWLIFYSHLCFSPTIHTTIQERIEVIDKLLNYIKEQNIEILTMTNAVEKLKEKF